MLSVYLQAGVGVRDPLVSSHNAFQVCFFVIFGGYSLCVIAIAIRIWCPSVCSVGILTVTHQRAACDAASIHFGPSIRSTDMLVYLGFLYLYEVVRWRNE